MPYEVGWLVENRVIVQRFYGVMELDQFRETVSKTTDMIVAGTPFVHVVTDMSSVQKFPMNLQALSSITGKKHPHMGWFIMVGANPLARFTMATLSQIINMRLRGVTTMTEALQFLN